MKLKAAAAAAALVAVSLLAIGGAGADTLVVAGQRAASATGFVVVGDEVFAPLLPALKHLGARSEVTPDSIKIVTAGGREILISRTRPEATRDGVLRELPGPPRSKGKALLLPARAVGSLLGCAVRWDEGSRTVFLHPWVRKFSLQAMPDRYRLTVGAEGPISYRTGQLEGPPRLYLDLLNVDLADIPSEVEVKGSYLRRARIEQNSLAPAPEGDVTRVVVELAEWRPYRVRASEDRCRVEVEFPLPEAIELPPEAPPVVLSGMSFRRASPRLAEVKVGVAGTAFCTSEEREEPPAVVVDFANADNRMTASTLEVGDKVVLGASVGPAPGKPGTQRLTIRLGERVGHSVVSEEGRVRVLLGRVELAGVRVVVDAGHGGHDPGAIGRSGLEEKEVNLDIARRVQRRLQAMGAEVMMTRMDDRPLRPWRRGNREEHRQELLARCAVANEGEAHLFVSIHANAREANPMAVRGTETYYRKSDSESFAGVMQKELVGAVGLPDGGVKYHPKPIVVLCQTNMPAVLVEVGYLSHPEDEAAIATAEVRERAAEGIANGVKRYVEEGRLLAELARREGAPGG
jgi:N-acetylmuramoyl-L-alanine amidase